MVAGQGVHAPPRRGMEPVPYSWEPMQSSQLVLLDPHTGVVQMDPFKDRVAVITGGAGGIGAAMARAFAGRGAKLVLADLDAAALERSVAELSSGGTQVLGVPTDVTKLDSVRALAEKTVSRFGTAHIVCNNAGVATFGEVRQATHQDWEFTMSVNFWGVVHGVEAFLPLLLQNGGGHIVNTASMAGLVGMQWLGIYCASKFAVVGLSEALHRELKPNGIGVSVLCPMIVATNINENSVRMRPTRLRNDGGDPPIPDASAMRGGVIQPDEVGRRVVRGIERQDLYILTHPEQREFLRRRAAKLDSMFEEGTW
jgi:NAD(P)-dependent dehydrogenase (short-subunit alcohol dehydrogenase family)